MRKALAVILVVMTCLMMVPVRGEASVTRTPYRTYTEDAKGNLILTQDAYVPMESFSHPDFEDIREMRVHDGRIHILDQKKDASAIYVYDTAFALLGTIVLPEDVQRPEGFHVTDGSVYVTDLKDGSEGALHVFDYDPMTFSLTPADVFLKPETPLFGDQTPFLPRKVSVDPRGNVYIISDGALNGVLQMSDTGRFFGFFGANKADTGNIRDRVTQFFSSTRDLVLPPTPTNIAIDPEGFIYTVTQGLKDTGLKKFNVASRNFLPESMSVVQGNVAVAPGNHGNIFTVSIDGVIREYDVEGNLLFSFGGSLIGDTRLGLFSEPVAISILSDNRILVADASAGNIQVFVETAFARDVHRALDAYMESDFDSGILLWEEVLLQNAWFDLAYKGMGHAYMSEGAYRLAMESYRKTDDIEGYSEAFWELRNETIELYVGWFVVVFFLMQALFWVKAWINRKGRTVLPSAWHERMARVKDTVTWKRLAHPFKVIRHPLDTFYDIKRKNDTSVHVATGLYVMMGVVYFVKNGLSNYIFVGDIMDRNIFLDLFLLYGGILVFLVMNYLVCSIREGSGKFSEVYIGFSYVLLPVMLVNVLMTGVSNVLTLNEMFIYGYIHQIATVWSVILGFFMVKDIYDYDVGETIGNIMVTMFSMVVAVFVGFMMYVVFNQSVTFFEELVREAILRVQGF
jgi:hypothetical protein